MMKVMNIRFEMCVICTSYLWMSRFTKHMHRLLAHISQQALGLTPWHAQDGSKSCKATDDGRLFRFPEIISLQQLHGPDYFRDASSSDNLFVSKILLNEHIHQIYHPYHSLGSNHL